MTLNEVNQLMMNNIALETALELNIAFDEQYGIWVPLPTAADKNASDAPAAQLEGSDGK